MFFVIKKKTLFVLIAIILIAIAGVVATVTVFTVAQANSLGTIVIDAGHGGVDVGVVGSTGITEAKINLKVSKELGRQLGAKGYKIVYTRTDDNGLYGSETKNRKAKDMAERKRIILASDADIVLSIHTNKFPSKERRGAQVFFAESSAKSKELAGGIQAKLNDLNNEYTGRTFEALKGDYFIILCSKAPSALIECGFLSNKQDEELLLNDKYCAKLCAKIVEGIIK